jgi:hypothetical protein
MLQLIITLVIIFTAAGIAVYRLVKYWVHPAKKCDGCGLYNAGCSPGEVKKHMRKQ